MIELIMKLEDLKVGATVSFHKIKNGKCCGLEDEILKITEINMTNWESCNCRLSNGVFTNNEAIELVNEKHLTIFDFIKESE